MILLLFEQILADQNSLLGMGTQACELAFHWQFSSRKASRAQKWLLANKQITSGQPDINLPEWQ